MLIFCLSFLEDGLLRKFSTTSKYRLIELVAGSECAE